MKISVADKIRGILKEKDMTIKELSILIGRSNQNMANKLKRDNFSINELIEIAEALNCELDVRFTRNEPKKTD